MFHFNNLNGDIRDGVNLPPGNRDMDQIQENNKLALMTGRP